MEAKIIMLETTNILKNGVTSDGKWFIGKDGFGRFINNDKDIIQHHFHLIDPNAEVCVGDWTIDVNCDLPHGRLTTIDNGIELEFYAKSSKYSVCKVLATTDKTLNLPQLSEQSIQLLIDYYNKNSKMPDEVEVEDAYYDYDTETHSKTTLFNLTNPQGTVDITIPEKKTYTKEEVESLIIKFKGDNLKHLNMRIVELNEWFNKNL